MGIGEWPAANGYKGFQCMYQRINAGAGSEKRVHGQGGFRVDQGNIRYYSLADNGKLNALALVGNNHKLRNVRRSTGCGWDEYQRRGGDAASVGGHNADGLGAVHGAAAANGHNCRAVVQAVLLCTQHDFLNSGVRGYCGKQMISNTLLLKALFDVLYPAGSHHAGVGNDQHLLCAETANEAACTVSAASTENNFG